MVTRKTAHIPAVAIAGIIMCVLATEARATSGTETPISLPASALIAPTSCTVAIGSKTLTVDTVPGGDSETFPHEVTGGSCPMGETCLEYDYRFTITPPTTLSKSYVTISSDIVIYEASPGGIFINDCIADKTPTNGPTACHHREAKFNPSGSPLNARVVVSRAAPRVSTAGAFVGSQSGFCLIQGPGIPVSPFAPVNTTSNQKAAGGKCDVTVTNGPDGKIPVKVETSTPGCAVASQVDVFINGKTIQDSSGEAFTYGTGTTTCYPTKPKPTCVCRNPSSPCPN